MRVVSVFADEFKRTSWIIFVVIFCMFLSGLNIADCMNSNFKGLIQGRWFTDWVNTVSWYLPVPLLLTLCQKRGSGEDFWGSMPYTVNGLYFCRLAYGLLFILLTGLAQLLLSCVMMHSYAFLVEDLGYLGFNTYGLYTLPLFISVNCGVYIITQTLFMLFNNRILASAAVFLLALIPELFIAPVSWFFGYSEAMDSLCEAKYRIMYGMFDYIPDTALSTGTIIYTVFIFAMLVLGIYLNRKNNQRGNSALVYNKAVNIMLIVLVVFFALNIADVIFVQGGVF